MWCASSSVGHQSAFLRGRDTVVSSETHSALLVWERSVFLYISMMQCGVHSDALSPLALRAWILLLWICTEATRWTHKKRLLL